MFLLLGEKQDVEISQMLALFMRLQRKYSYSAGITAVFTDQE